MLTQLTFVSWWQMIYDTFISSHMITHWCFLLPWCSGWAVCLLCAECAQPLVTVHSSNPALEAATNSYSGYDCIGGVAQQNRRCAESSTFPICRCLTWQLQWHPQGVGEGVFYPLRGVGRTNQGQFPQVLLQRSPPNPPANSKPPAQTLHLHLISISNFLPWCKPPFPLPTTYPIHIL